MVLRGGLHVILTFIPANQRAEDNAFAVAQRRGEGGSARFIVERISKYKDSYSIEEMKKVRDLDEMYRLNKVELRHYSKTTLEEKAI